MKKLFRFLVPVLLLALIVASCVWYLFVYDRNFTRDMLLQQARYNDLNHRPKLSSLFYDLAYNYSGQDHNVAIELANQYKADGNYTKAEFTLTNAIHDSATTELYMALCKTYVEQDKLLDAVNLLANISNAQIKAELDAMRPAAPTADHEPGFYSQYIDVALDNVTGTLYYSTDGEYPTISRPAYSSPITLGGGETVIYAISVADNGLVSPLAILGYTVNGVIEPAIFSDSTMEATVRQMIGANETEIIYTNELWDITEFTVPAGIGSLDDLKLMPYLRSLTMEDQRMSSLNVLINLPKLNTLKITDCTFPTKDLSIIANLPNLKALTLSDCGLSTIADLSGAASLEFLDLSHNGGLRNLDVLAPMTSLKEIYLQHNAVVDLSALAGLTNLEKLDVSYNSLTTLAPIATCIRLNWLNADGNQLTTLDGICELNLLAELSVNYNKLTDISGLAACPKLATLSVANNQITDISDLATLPKLEKLDFSYNTVAALPQWQDDCTLRTIDGSYNALLSIDSLAKVSTLTYIYMDYNQITDISKLAECYNLVQVNVFGNVIKDVSALTEHDIIVNYDPTL